MGLEYCEREIVKSGLNGDVLRTSPNSLLSTIFGDTFILMVSGFNAGAYNMQLDVELVHKLQEKAIQPVFRLYGWQPWCVSVGYHQNHDHISSSECSKKGIELVRRPTGGRAVLHANEVTYSIITYCDNQQEYYKNIHTLLLGALQKYSSDITFEKNHHDFRGFRRINPEMSKMCFTSSARYELKYQGKKIVGSAQRMYKNILLQHGSILLDRSHEKIITLMNNVVEDNKSTLLTRLRNTSTNLEEVTSSTVSWDDCAEQISSHVYSLLP